MIKRFTNFKHSLLTLLYQVWDQGSEYIVIKFSQIGHKTFGVSNNRAAAAEKPPSLCVCLSERLRTSVVQAWQTISGRLDRGHARSADIAATHIGGGGALSRWRATTTWHHSVPGSATPHSPALLLLMLLLLVSYQWFSHVLLVSHRPHSTQRHMQQVTADSEKYPNKLWQK